MASSKAKPHFFLSYEKDQKKVASPHLIGLSHPKPRSDFFSYTIKSSQFYSDFDQSDDRNYDAWCAHICSIDMDFEGEFTPSTEALDFRIIDKSSYFRRLCQEFMDAIEDYKKYQKESTQASKISKESAKRFLLLLPILADYRPKVHIDAQNGCFNFDMQTRDNGILSTQISDTGQVHYAYVAQHTKIYKITGTAKFKDPKDFIKFNKILKML